MNTPRLRMAFVSPSFLFPNDTGGKIRTSNVLRGLHGATFDVTLISPATPEQRARHEAEIGEVCDRFVAWPGRAAPLPRWRRAVDLLDRLPVNVVADRSAVARDRVGETLAAGRYDVVVFDFVHAAVLRPDRLDAATVCFTHNVEAEIFERHATQSAGPLMRAVWSSQYRKMLAYEASALSGFTQVVAVSERDAAGFRSRYGIRHTSLIRTGVDLDKFTWQAPAPVTADRPPTVVFTGSMDWAANVDGVRFFLQTVWPSVVREVPQARFVVVGRSPPAELVELGRAAGQVEFTGWVDDVRPHVRDAHVAVVPLRVGGGTRIKVYEAMGLGCPVVSTSIGIEGLEVEDGVHYLRRDGARELALAVVALLRDPAQRLALSTQARARVEAQFGHVEVARDFEQACLRAIDARRTRASGGAVRAVLGSSQENAS